jgi:hypothetical protein
MKISRIEGVDVNYFDYLQNYFTLDLHKCESSIARTVISTRLRECYRFGIDFLEVVHGQPKSAFSLVDALHDVLRDKSHHTMLAGCIPLNQVGWMQEYEDTHVATRLLLRKNPRTEPQNNGMIFSGFRLKYAKAEEPQYVPFEREPPEDGYSLSYLNQVIFDSSSGCNAVLQSALAELSREIPTTQAKTWEGVPVTCFQVYRPVFRRLISVLQRPLSMQQDASRIVGCPEEFCVQAASSVFHARRDHYVFFSIRDTVGEPKAVGFTGIGLDSLRDLWQQRCNRGLECRRLAKQRFKIEMLEMFDNLPMCFDLAV